MRRFVTMGLLLAVPTASAQLIGPAAPGSVSAVERETEPVRALIFSKTAGFRHANIPDAVRAIKALGEDNRIDFVHTEDSAEFTSANLSTFDAVIFLSTTGDVLNAEQETAFESYIRSGGGFVGIHAAADTEYEWPFYAMLVGAYFKSHPQVQRAEIDVLTHDHPSTAHLPERWVRVDEWYCFRSQPHDGVTRLLNIDESTYQGGTMGEEHPIAWYQTVDAGRAFYTAGGHTSEAFEEPDFLQHILGGILWSVGEPGTTPTAYQTHKEAHHACDTCAGG